MPDVGRSIAGSTVCMYDALWASVAHLRAAFNHPEFKQALGHDPSSAVASPHLFTRLTVSNLRALLIGPLQFTPIDDGGRRGYAFSGTVALDRLLAGAVEWPTMMASPTGTADGWPLKVAGVSGLDHAA